MTIRGRGNSTWDDDKKPYKIKLDKKADIFGLGKNKHWVLIANAFDHTLVKDRMTAWLGNYLGFEFTPTGYPVDLVMNGKYLGSYYFSENVRVDSNRLEIDELTEDITDPDSIEITGGYLLQNDLQTRDGSPDIFKTKHYEGWATKTPSFDTSDDGYENPAQQQYIQNHIQKVEDALFGDDFRNEEGTSYHDLMDLDSAAKYWLINTASANRDAYGTGSTYIYKKRADDKIYWGPLWDFDYAWDGENDDYFSFNDYWVPAMMYDTGDGGFVEEIQDNWPVLKEALQELIADNGIIDGYYEETKSSQAIDAVVNPERHGPLGDDEEYDEGFAASTGPDMSYLDRIEELKSWISQRIDWMDEKLPTLDNLMHKVRFYVDGELYNMNFTPDGSFLTGVNQYPEKEGMVFTGWLDEYSQPLDLDALVYEDMDLYAEYVSEEEATHGEDIALSSTTDMVKFDGDYSSYNIKYLVIPDTAQYNKVQWSSSDESIATVDEYGCVTIKRPGTVTFTGKLKYGNSRDFTLVITDGDVIYPDSIHPESETIYLLKGQQCPFNIITDPYPAVLGSFEYTSDNEEVATVGYYGELTGIDCGITQINTVMDVRDDTWELIGSYDTQATVIVSYNEAVQNVNKLINELPSKVTAEDLETIETVRDAYDALTLIEKDSVPQVLLSKLEALETKAEADKLQKAVEEAKKAADEAKAEAEKATKAAEEAKADPAAKEAAEKEAAEAKQAQADAEKALKEAQDALAAAEKKAAAAEEKAKKAQIAQKKAEAKNYTVTGLKVTSKNKKITVKYKKNKKATGYQIQYKLSTAKKWKNLKKATTKLKFTSKTLKKGKKYQVRVRTYTKIDGKKYYGRWTAKKTIKVK